MNNNTTHYNVHGGSMMDLMSFYNHTISKNAGFAHVISTLLKVLYIRQTHFVIRCNNIAVSPLSNSRGRQLHSARQSFLLHVIYARRDVTSTKKNHYIRTTVGIPRIHEQNIYICMVYIYLRGCAVYIIIIIIIIIY